MFSYIHDRWENVSFLVNWIHVTFLTTSVCVFLWKRPVYIYNFFSSLIINRIIIIITNQQSERSLVVRSWDMWKHDLGKLFTLKAPIFWIYEIYIFSALFFIKTFNSRKNYLYFQRTNLIQWVCRPISLPVFSPNQNPFFVLLTLWGLIVLFFILVSTLLYIALFVFVLSSL
jgi:hypothetical protein